VAAFIFSQLSLAWVTPFSANSRKAAGTSIFGMSNLGRSKRGISNFGASVLALVSRGLDLLEVVVVLMSDMAMILSWRVPGPQISRHIIDPGHRLDGPRQARGPAFTAVRI
jgi:hypothetical protein